MMMRESYCAVLPVVNVSDKVVGLITDRDICMGAASKHRDPSTIAVAEIITGDTDACDPNTDVRDALKTMKEKRVRRLAVIDAEGNLQGILSMSDAVCAPRKMAQRNRIFPTAT
jgi:CBS domain-containing protein